MYTFNPSHQFPEGDSVLFFVGGITLRGVEGEAVHVLDDGDAELVNPRTAVEPGLIVAIGMLKVRPLLLKGCDVSSAYPSPLKLTAFTMSLSQLDLTP